MRRIPCGLVLLAAMVQSGGCGSSEDLSRIPLVKNEMAGDLSRHLLRGYNWAIGQGREW